MTEMALPIGTIGVTLLMAAITYFWRTAGFWTMGLFEMTPRLRRGLESLPGAIVISTVLPLVARTGPVAAASIAAATLVMIVWKNEFLAVILGVVVAAGLRFFL